MNNWTREQWAAYRRSLGWQAGSYGAGKRHWHVYRETEHKVEQHETVNGRTVWFATMDAARARAAKLNGEPAPERTGF